LKPISRDGTGVPTRNWDISADGRRFLMEKLEERKSQPITEMILVQNWAEELKRLVPAASNYVQETDFC
jgi:hypothetical protein